MFFCGVQQALCKLYTAVLTLVNNFDNLILINTRKLQFRLQLKRLLFFSGKYETKTRI